MPHAHTMHLQYWQSRARIRPQSICNVTMSPRTDLPPAKRDDESMALNRRWSSRKGGKTSLTLPNGLEATRRIIVEWAAISLGSREKTRSLLATDRGDIIGFMSQFCVSADPAPARVFDVPWSVAHATGSSPFREMSDGALNAQSRLSPGRTMCPYSRWRRC
jgi:hypothetical protein